MQTNYSLRRIVPPVEDVITLEQARRNCGVDGDEHDPALAELITQAREYVEERTDATLLTTTWEMTMDDFPRRGTGGYTRVLYMPRWPLQSIESVDYIAADGSEQSIPGEDLVVRKDEFGRGRLALKNWRLWPYTACTPDAVKITYIAGWESPELVPAMWTRAMLMLVAWWLEQREAGIVGSTAAEAPIGVQDLLDSVATADDFEL